MPVSFKVFVLGNLSTLFFVKSKVSLKFKPKTGKGHILKRKIPKVRNFYTNKRKDENSIQ